MIKLSNWSSDSNFHVRRLVSEGTRPRLPWSKRISAINGDPTYNFALLEPLLGDPSLYVRKSVANHINDLTKEHKGITLDWLREHMDHRTNHVSWVIRYGLRSLTKSQDKKALELLNILYRDEEK